MRAGAGAAGLAVGLPLSGRSGNSPGPPEPVALATLASARSAAGPVAVHLDHATSVELVRAAAGIGISSVMFDASALEYAANLAATAEVAAWCHQRGVWVEAELGEIGGKDGVHAAGAPTKPQDAVAYVR